MKMELRETGLEYLGLMQKRVQYLIGAKVHDRKKMIRASQHIDALRKKVKGINSVEIIRKYRGAI